MRRIAFVSNDVRIAFFDLCRRRLKCSSWDAFYKCFNLNRGLGHKYRTGFLLLPEEIYKKIVGLSSVDPEQFGGNIIYREKNWGVVKGGHSAYKKNRKEFEKGRKKGLKKMLALTKDKITIFDIRQKISLELCEFIGAFIGDAFTANYNCHYITQFTGDRRYDKAYYSKYLIPISQKLFNNIKVHIQEKNNTLRVNYYSKRLHHFLTKRFSFPSGKKVYTVRIPHQVIEKGKKFFFALIRGLFDTDGCVYYDMRDIYKKPYLRIQLKLANPGLILQVKNLLNEYGIRSYVDKSSDYHLYIYNNQAQTFIREIGFSNKKHLDKLKPS